MSQKNARASLEAFAIALTVVVTGSRVRRQRAFLQAAAPLHGRNRCSTGFLPDACVDILPRHLEAEEPHVSAGQGGPTQAALQLQDQRYSHWAVPKAVQARGAGFSKSHCGWGSLLELLPLSCNSNWCMPRSPGVGWQLPPTLGRWRPSMGSPSAWARGPVAPPNAIEAEAP